MLARMFSGRYEDNLDRDKDGNAFVDYSSRVMNNLIRYLRLVRDAVPGTALVMYPEVSPEDRAETSAMLRFFGLSHCFTTMFVGIQNDVEISTLSGWSMLCSKPYSHPTIMEDFRVPEGLAGTALLLGARRRGSGLLAVAAMGRVEVVTDERESDEPQLH